MAQASAYGLVLVAIILIPIVIATTVFKPRYLRCEVMRLPQASITLCWMMKLPARLAFQGRRT
jgi:hypothetical protein